jgi:arabinosyltransferase
MESGLTTADYGWGTKNFRQLGLRKTELIINLLRAGADPVLTDADALITRDPSPFIARLLPEAQILVTSDHLMSTTQVGPEPRPSPLAPHPSPGPCQSHSRRPTP